MRLEIVEPLEVVRLVLDDNHVGIRLDLTCRTANVPYVGPIEVRRVDGRLLSERVHRAHDKLVALWRLAELAHPERPLQRGFVRVTDRSGKTIVHAADARAAGSIDLHFADGRVAAHIGDGTGPVPFRPAKRVERKGRDPYLPGQADLFDSGE